MTGAAQSNYRVASDLLAAAVGIVAVTFGVLSDSAGLSLAKTMALSMFVFTGASQFAAVSIVDDGGTAAAAVGSALLLAARNALYGPVVAKYLVGARWKQVVGAQLVIDETTAMATAQIDEATARAAFWRTAIGLYLFWNVGTVIGHVLGGVIGDPTDWGLDAAFSAAFVALLMPHVRSRPGQLAAVGGAVLALVALPLLPAGSAYLVAALAVIPAAMVRRRSEAPPPGGPGARTPMDRP